MRILVINYEYPPLGGGAAPVTRDLAKALKVAGHCVDVITMGFGTLPYYEEDEVRIFRLKCWRKRKSSCKPWEQLTFLFSVRRFMREHMKDNRYDVCHCHFVIPSGEVARWIRKKYGIPYVITAHGSDVEGHNTKLTMRIMHFFLRPFWRKIVADSEVVISPSVYLMERMKKNYSKGNYVFIPNGIEYQRFSDFSLGKKDEKNILIMGRLQCFKNVQCILQAISKLEVDLLEGWTVNIVGDGPYRRQLEDWTERLGIQHIVHFHGWIDNGTSAHLEFLKNAAIYISASLFENCPMSVIEAGVSGCQLILSDIPAHRQLIELDKCFFNPYDSDVLAEKMRVLFRDEDDYRVHGLEKFDWTNIMNRYVVVFSQAINEG